MTSAKLIELIRQADPSGEMLVSHVACVNVEPAYYDGTLLSWELDGDADCPVSGHYTRQGSKLTFDIYGIDWMADCRPNLPMTFGDVADEQHFRVKAQEAQAQHRRIHRQITRDHFIKWLNAKIQSAYGYHACKEIAGEWFDANFRPDEMDPGPGSPHDRFESFWERVVRFKVTTAGLVLTREAS